MKKKIVYSLLALVAAALLGVGIYKATNPVKVELPSDLPSFESIRASESDKIEFYYISRQLPDGATARSIHATNESAVLTYNVNDEANSVIEFEWVWLQNETNYRFALEGKKDYSYQYLYDDKGIPTDCICFIPSADEDDEATKTEIGRDHFWRHDGYWFRMYIPSSVLSDDLSFDVKQVSLEQ